MLNHRSTIAVGQENRSISSETITRARTMIMKGKSTDSVNFDRVEDYQRYRTDFSSESDGSVCQCRRSGSFGKNCECQLPVGKTIEETLEWPLVMRKENSEKVQIYGDVIQECYVSVRERDR